LTNTSKRGKIILNRGINLIKGESMKSNKTILALFLITAVAVSAYTQQQYDMESDFKFEWDKDVDFGIVISGYLGSKKEINIPPSIQNAPITGIGNKAFGNNRTITRVIIPNSVTFIGGGAFERCTGLLGVTIPDSVISIKEDAFFGCINLPSVTIPNSVTSIGDFAFDGCTKLTSVTMPGSVTSLGRSAFSGCTGLTSVTFEGTINSSNFDRYYVFPGDLRDRYFANDGGTGTYIRFSNGEKWRKR
jgi:hypothetical protein